jgi:hypothetical protein
LWRGWKCNFFCLWCKMEVFKDGYGVQTSLTRYLSEQAFGSSRLQSLIYVLVAETSWFGHSLLNGSNIVCKNCGTWDDDGPGPEISFSTFEDYAGSLEYIARELGPAWVWEKNGTSCMKGRRCQEGKRQSPVLV